LAKTIKYPKSRIIIPIAQGFIPSIKPAVKIIGKEYFCGSKLKIELAPQFISPETVSALQGTVCDSAKVKFKRIKKERINIIKKITALFLFINLGSRISQVELDSEK
jgi:hypothetical protein